MDSGDTSVVFPDCSVSDRFCLKNKKLTKTSEAEDNRTNNKRKDEINFVYKENDDPETEN